METQQQDTCKTCGSPFKKHSFSVMGFIFCSTQCATKFRQTLPKTDTEQKPARYGSFGSCGSF